MSETQSQNQPQKSMFFSLGHTTPVSQAPQQTSTHSKKSQQLRNRNRNQHIDNIKKAARFNWNVQQTLDYLKTVDNTHAESEEIILNAIDQGNLEFLVHLVISADSLIRCAIIDQSTPILQLISDNIERPSSIMLLGNLCSLYPQYIKALKPRKMLTKIMKQLVNKKSSKQNLEVYSWTLTQMCRQPLLMNEEQVYNCLPLLYRALSQIFCSRESSNQLCTHLCRLLSQFSAVACFSPQFLDFIIGFHPQRMIDKNNVFIALQNQVKQLQFSQDTNLRKNLFKYIIWLHKQISNSTHKSKQKSLYQLLGIIIKKTQHCLSQQIVYDNAINSILTDYKYGNAGYYNLLYQSFLRLPNTNNPQLLQIIREKGLLQNLINDIIDPNFQVGYLCIKVVNVLVTDTVKEGNNLFVQWMLGLGLQSKVEEFIESVGNRNSMTKEAEVLLDLIYTQPQ